MKKRAELTFSKKSYKKNNIKKYLIILLLLLSFGSLVFYEYFSYRLFFRSFTSSFNNNEYPNANNILLTDQNFNPFRLLLLEKDLSNYFTEKVNNLSNDLDNGITNEQAILDILNEIKRYNISFNVSNSTISSMLFDDSYESAVNLFNAGQYIQAYGIFSNIKSTDLSYASSIEYIKKCKEYLTNEALDKATNLCKNKEYSKALTVLEGIRDIALDNDKFNSKVSEVKKYYSDSLVDENATTTTSSSLTTITTSNINTLSLESLTSYLVQVDLNNQQTNIYMGKKNNWTLLKSFPCSTGTSEEPTPSGVYTIKDRGEWFFSKDYMQGGKYWVQFNGDYLFHSLPYDEDKTTIVDYTLDTPASHGCVRLSDNDSKWIYDNITKGTKVIIQ